MFSKIMSNSFYRIARTNIFIILMFAFFSILSGLIMIHAHEAFVSYDMSFHYSRIYEMRYSLIHGSLFNDVSMTYFGQNGSAVMTMYPKINLIPIIILSFFIKSFIKLVYITFVFRNFFALIIAYFSCLKFTKNKVISYIFSICYTFSTVVLFYGFFDMDLGVTSSLIYLPLVIFGIYELLDYFYWKELALGFSAIVLCHVITAVVTMIFILLVIAINYKKVKDIKVVKSIIKVLINVVLLTGIFWIPFFIISIQNHISMPVNSIPIDGLDYSKIIFGAFNNELVGPYISVVAILGLIISLVNYKKLSLYSKQILWISIIFIVITSKFIPWFIIRNTFLERGFQTPYRLLVIPQLLLTYLFSEQLKCFIKNNKRKVLVVFFISFIVMCAQINNQKSIIDSANTNKVSDDFISKLKNNGVSYVDYFPKNSLKVSDELFNHRIIVNNDREATSNLLGNGKFSFKLDKSTKSLKMPFLIYNGIDYQVKVDGNNYKFHADQDSRLTINHLHKGKHTVQVIVHKSWYDYLSYVLSALGVIILAFAWIRLLILKRKNK